MHGHLRRRKRRQAEHLGHVDQTRARQTPWQRQHANTRVGRRQCSCDPPTKKRVDPADLGLRQQAHCQFANPTGFRDGDERQQLAFKPCRHAGEPSIAVFEQHFAIAPPPLVTDYGDIDFAVIEVGEHLARIIDSHLQLQSRIERIHARQYFRQFGTGHMIADRDGEFTLRFGRRHQCQVLRGHQRARMRQKRFAVCRQPYLAGRAVKQTPSDRFLEAPQFQTHARLRQAERVCCMRKAAQVGDQNKCFHRREIEMLAHS